MTAAHCVSAFLPGETVYLGGIKRDGSDAVATVTVQEVRSHPDYDDFSLDSDFMVLKIQEDMSSVPVVPWNSDGSTPPDDATGVHMGFGVTEQGTTSDDLLQVQLASINQEECATAIQDYFGDDFLTDSMLCAGDEVGRSSCNGDSGSPLIYNDEIVGLSSWGSFFCGDGSPSVRRKTAQGRFVSNIYQGILSC